jgi:hypothetical protein
MHRQILKTFEIHAGLGLYSSRQLKQAQAEEKQKPPLLRKPRGCGHPEVPNRIKGFATRPGIDRRDANITAMFLLVEFRSSF